LERAFGPALGAGLVFQSLVGKDATSAEDFVLGTVVLGGASLDNAPAGVVPKLIDSIIDKSSLEDPIEEQLSRSRSNEMIPWEHAIPMLISHAFPAVHPDEVLGWTMDKVVLYATEAEKIVGTSLTSADGPTMPPGRRPKRKKKPTKPKPLS